MTPEERAEEVIGRLGRGLAYPDDMKKGIADAIRSAVAIEQSRCLDLTHGYYVTGLSDDQRQTVDRTIVAIRGAIRDSEKEREPA